MKEYSIDFMDCYYPFNEEMYEKYKGVLAESLLREDYQIRSANIPFIMDETGEFYVPDEYIVDYTGVLASISEDYIGEYDLTPEERESVDVIKNYIKEENASTYFTVPFCAKLNKENLENEDCKDLMREYGFIPLDEKEGLYAIFNNSALIMDSNIEDYVPQNWWNDNTRWRYHPYFVDMMEQNLEKVKVPCPDYQMEKYKYEDSDRNLTGARNVIYTGETGCGKTYKAVNEEIDAGNRFVYLAPCRQLVYETYMKYADDRKDALSTGEVKINKRTESDNFYGVFESMNENILDRYDTLIIDEAHFINDSNRGVNLINLIKAAREKGMDIKLLTATNTLDLNDFEEIKLQPVAKVPEKVEVDWNQAYQNMLDGYQTIWFVPTIDSTYSLEESLKEKGIKARAMNSEMLPSDRLQTQIDFANGDVQVILSTNLLAQGVNFVCENMIISYDQFNTPELKVQKLGRLGRIGLQGKHTTDKVFYASDEEMEEIVKDKPVLIREGEVDDSHINYALNNAIYMAEHGEEISYNTIKYCQPEFMKYAKVEIAIYEEDEEFSRKIEILKDALNTIEQEHSKIEQIVRANMEYKKKENYQNKEEAWEEKYFKKLDIPSKTDNSISKNEELER